MELREQVCVDKMGSRAWREKVCVDKMGSGAVQQHNNHHGPCQSRFRAILVFRGVVVGVAKANESCSLSSAKHLLKRDFLGSDSNHSIKREIHSPERNIQLSRPSNKQTMR